MGHLSEADIQPVDEDEGRKVGLLISTRGGFRGFLGCYDAWGLGKKDRSIMYLI